MKFRHFILFFLIVCLGVSVLTLDADAAVSTPAAPVVTVSTSEYSGKVQLDWKAVKGASSYKVYRSTSKNGTYSRVTTTTSTSFVNSSTVAGTKYYYYVVAVGSNGSTSKSSKIVSKTCCLPRPSITLSNVESSGKIKITWDAVKGATKYQVYRSTDGKNFSRISTTTKTSVTNTSAAAGTKYYYKVKAIASNSDANSAFSTVKNRICKLARPTITKTGTSEYSGKVVISWDAVEGAVSYKVYRADSKNGSYTMVGSTSSTSYTNSSSKSGKTYYYKVRAIAKKEDANSAQSAAVSQICALERPDIKLENIASSGKIKISWNAVDDAVQYQVYRSTDGKKFSRISTTTKTSVTNTSAAAGTKYYYKVRALAKNADANSAFSAVKNKTCKLAQPTITETGVSEYSGKIIVSWNAVEGAVSYKLYRADSKNGTYTMVGSTSSTSYTNSSCESGKTYYFKVRAVAKNEDANSAQSTAVSQICALERPDIKLENVISSGKIKISWNTVEGAEAYEVHRSTDNQNFICIGTTSSTSLTDTGAVAGTKCYYKVRAISADPTANSPFSTVRYQTCDLARPVVTLSNMDQTDYIQLTWASIDDAVEYRIYRSTAQNGSYSRIGITTESSFVDSSALVGVNYFYKVTAYCSNTNGNSADSEIRSGVCSRMSVLVNLNEDNKPRLTWNGVEGAVNYAVYRTIDGLPSATRQIARTEFTSLTNSSVVSGITYLYTVHALDADGNILRQSDNQAIITTPGPQDETLVTNYVKGILLSLYHLPDNQAEYLTVPYMTQVELGAAVSSSESGSWYRVFYKNDLYYVWMEPGENLFTTQGSTFKYYSDNPYQQEVVDLASYIAFNWKTVYEHNASKGEQKPDGTYGFDCSGFVRYVMNTVMQQYVPTYKIVAEIEDLVVTGNIYNKGYRGEFSVSDVALEDIQPGDVIFFSQLSENDHCGIYLGNGEFVHSSNYWENSVCVSPLTGSYVDDISVIRRYLPDEVISADTPVFVDPHNKDGSTTSQCKLYQERSTNSNQLRVLYAGSTVTVLFTDSDLWAYVQLDDGTCGWILTRNLGTPVR